MTSNGNQLFVHCFCNADRALETSAGLTCVPSRRGDQLGVGRSEAASLALRWSAGLARWDSMCPCRRDTPHVFTGSKRRSTEALQVAHGRSGCAFLVKAGVRGGGARVFAGMCSGRGGRRGHASQSTAGGSPRGVTGAEGWFRPRQRVPAASNPGPTLVSEPLV